MNRFRNKTPIERVNDPNDPYDLDDFDRDTHGDNDLLSNSIEFRNIMDYQETKRRSDIQFRRDNTAFIISIIALIVALIALFR
ncbi:hypothetical protein IR148_00460 [Dysgonomonas mossii]|uniref:Uncharacterized protein n=1 Tax=Dysgonomonas mossii TaxID=163665 RepID=A0A4Y9IS04_9BACT|nr:hypothetical protein [Dysgonomonas mossii]MBF0759513.1 hypothetical protein [Dysgonomonas mossii]TFU90484.1 hypothetical protein E4T88_00465 [Dysgonomonas mossii]